MSSGDILPCVPFALGTMAVLTALAITLFRKSPPIALEREAIELTRQLHRAPENQKIAPEELWEKVYYALARSHPGLLQHQYRDAVHNAFSELF